MATKKREAHKEPWVDNYPPLKEWLHNARPGKMQSRCMWQQRVGEDGRDMVECWLVNMQPILVLIHGDGHGWNVFTSANTGEIAATLADAEERTKRPYT